MKNLSDISFWRWGNPQHRYQLHSKSFWHFLQKHIDYQENALGDNLNITDYHTQLSQSQLKKLHQIFEKDSVFTDTLTRVRYSAGKSYPDIISIKKGILAQATDAVVFPTHEDQIAELLLFAQTEQINIIPFGGGTSVVGGVSPHPKTRNITLSLSKLNRVLKVDDESHSAHVQAGILGPQLEQHLNEKSYTFGHFPQSFEYSTLGGWIAARSAGQNSTGYGRIEDLILGITIITPKGKIVVKPHPASATGPKIKELILGSEGCIGIITEAIIQIRRLPKKQLLGSIIFPDLASGIQAVKDIVRFQHPIILRLSDANETHSFFEMEKPEMGMKEFRSILKYHTGKFFLDRLGYNFPQCTFLLFGIDGDSESIRQQLKSINACCKTYGGKYLGKGMGKAWSKHRFELPYLRDLLIEKAILIDTLETATTFANLNHLYHEVKSSLENALPVEKFPIFVMCHISHVYHTGASLYFTFFTKQNQGCELEQWQILKDAASKAIIMAGGTISHHHGIGTDHAAYMNDEHGTIAIEALNACKLSLDPHCILNRGKLGL